MKHIWIVIAILIIGCSGANVSGSQATALPPTLTAAPATPTEAGPAIPPVTTPGPNGSRVEVKYDKFLDMTTVLTRITPQSEITGVQILMFGLVYTGRAERGEPESIMVAWTRFGEGWAYLKDHDLVLLLDGEIRIMPETKQDGQVVTGGATEIISANLTRTQFLQLANAKAVEGRLGAGQFSFSDHGMESIRELASRLNP